MEKIDKIIYAFVFGIVIAITLVGYISYNTRTQEFKSSVNELKLRFETKNLDIKQVDINSPVIYVRYETLDNFLQQAKEMGVSTIYIIKHDTYGYLYFFNDSFTIGHKKYIDSGLVNNFLEEQK
jgi:hypothetical protein